MIPIKQLHYFFKLELDKVDTLSRPNVRPHQVDIYLRKGIREWFKDRRSFAFDQDGFETNEEAVQALSNFHIKSPNIQPGIAATAIADNIYELPFDKLEEEPAFITSVFADIYKDGCEKERVRMSFIRSNEDFNHYLSPSWKFRQGYYSVDMSSDLDGKSIYIDTQGEYSVGNVYVSYLKWPAKVFYSGYTDINGLADYQSASPPIDSDVDENYIDEVIHFAVLEMKQDMGDPEWQISKLRTSEI
jgi:hypothetical protein